MILVYDYLSPSMIFSQGILAHAYFLVMATDEEGDIPYSLMAKTYEELFQHPPVGPGVLGPFPDKTQMTTYAQALAKAQGSPRVVLHAAPDWNRLVEKARDPKELEAILYQGEVFQGVEQTARGGLLRRFFKDS